MKLTFDKTTMCGAVIIDAEASTRTVELSDDVIAFLGPDGEIADLEILDTRPFGETFDHAAAERALAWAREQLTARGLA